MLGLDTPDHNTLTQIGISTAAWSAVFVLINGVLLRRRSVGFNNRAVSFLHALVALLLCPAALDWHHPFSGFGQKTTAYQVLATVTSQPQSSRSRFSGILLLTFRLVMQRFIMNLSLGYFTYDMLCCLYIKLDLADLAHHLCTMLGLAVGVCNGVVSSVPVACCRELHQKPSC